ncbi:hypothetical protein NW752_002865 [Fusarium irregulare]|uniref:Cell wall protein n=1 Tax=Fusarium irregulare TaxID=2494466 RepID=A0A9W8Q0L3_9HYPO|nr:hypothetical protein NW766_000530 [Fusarium irregulare]KAJ4025396.1 hypothetical protein NW752_002865 [Fusarium irregulare]
MSVYKLKTLASILALCAPLIAATDGQGESVQSAHTDAPYTHEYGAGISDGSVVHSLTVCSVVHETKCIDTTSVAGETVQPSAASAASSVLASGQPSVPAGGEQTTYHDEGVSASTEGAPAPTVPVVSTTVVPSAPGAPGASGTNYAPPAGETASAASGAQGSMPPVAPSGAVPSDGGVVQPQPSLISTTDVAGNPTVLTTLYSEPSAAASDTATAVVTDSETVYDTTAVSGTATGTDSEETGDIDATGTPSVTASAASKKLSPGAILGFAAVIFAVVF